MDTVFLKLLNMSITASWLILAVVVIRFALKKAPKWITCLLWAVVAIRLVCPFSFESALSLVPSTETIPTEIFVMEPPESQQSATIDIEVNPHIPGEYTPETETTVDRIQVGHVFWTIAWLVGLAAMLSYAAVSYLLMRRRVRASIHVRDNFWICDDVKTPFILGVIKPRIYLPSGMDAQTEAHVVAHENAHLKRRDHLWKPLGFLILSVYWFNPLCWLAYILLCRDIELACDERVIRGMEKDDMLAYSEALLSCSVPRRMVMICPLAFGEVGVKERIKTVLNYKKQAFWIIVAAVAACIVVAVCFLTNPKDDEQDLSFLNYENLVALVAQSDTLAAHLSNKSGATYEYSIKGSELARLLDAAQWSRQNGILRSVQRDAEKSKESIQIDIDDSLYLRVFDLNTAYIHDGSIGDGRYYRTGDDDYSTILGLISGTNHTAVLSLNDVIILSQKGDDLMWSDFDSYAYTETGSGLYIRVYQINDSFSLWIGGGSTEEPPMYIRLVSDANPDDYIDIRTDSVTDFISAHRFDALPVTFGSADLDRDGSAESFEVSETDPAGIYTLSVRKDDGSVLWSEEAGTTHVGWNGLYLYRDEDGSCLLRYNPTMYHGNAEYHYELFTLEGGEEHIIASRSVEFSINPDALPTNEKWAEMDSFAAEVNALLKSSVVLLSTAKEGELFLGEVSAEPFMEYYAIMDGIVDPLDAAVSAAILEHNGSDDPDGLFHCESHVTLATVSGTPKVGANTHEVIVYAMVLYQEYNIAKGGIQEVSGSHIPTALTFEVGEGGQYTLTEYWIPRDGSYYAPDIREKLPADIAEDALDTQKYILAQKQSCYAQAVEYGKIDTDTVVEGLLEIITSSPATSSNPGDYIDAHPIEYRELTYYGDYTLRYVFSEFLKGGQTDLRGHIMRSVMDDLIGGEALKLEAATGQEYFDAWREHMEQVYDQHDKAYMLENCPKGWLLLQMID